MEVAGVLGINRHLVIDGICGTPLSNMAFAVGMEKRGLAKFAGNQWNEEWAWSREALGKLALEDLYALYSEIKAGLKG
jgi:hypothetical protein